MGVDALSKPLDFQPSWSPGLLDSQSHIDTQDTTLLTVITPGGDSQGPSTRIGANLDCCGGEVPKTLLLGILHWQCQREPGVIKTGGIPRESEFPQYRRGSLATGLDRGLEIETMRGGWMQGGEHRRSQRPRRSQ